MGKKVISLFIIVFIGWGLEATAEDQTSKGVLEATLKDAKVLLIDKMAGWDGQDYMRLLEIAAMNNIELVLATGYKARPDILNGNYDGIIVFGGGGGYNKPSYGGTTGEQLVDLQVYAKKGGRFVFFALPRINNFNDELQSLFKISAGSDYGLTPPKKSVISLNGGILTHLWEGLEVGSKKCYERNLGLKTYFASLDSKQKTTKIKNKEGEWRKLSVYGAIGQGEYLFISSFATGGGGISYRNIGNPLHDGNISAWDNEIASKRLLTWLAGR